MVMIVAPVIAMSVIIVPVGRAVTHRNKLMLRLFANIMFLSNKNIMRKLRISELNRTRRRNQR